MNKIKEAVERLKRLRGNSTTYGIGFATDALQTALNLMNEYLELDNKLFPKEKNILKLLENNLECKDDDVIGCHINGKNLSAKEILHELKLRYLKNGLSKEEIAEELHKAGLCAYYNYREMGNSGELWNAFRKKLAQAIFNAYQEKGEGK